MWFNKTREVIRNQLRQGLTPGRCAAAIATGCVCGVFPIMGLSGILGAGFAGAFRLNQPITYAMNWAMFFVKAALIIPFLRLGEWLHRADPLAISLFDLTERFVSAPLVTLRTFSWSFWHAIAGWLVCAPILFLLIYLIAVPIVRRSARAIKAWQGAPG